MRVGVDSSLGQMVRVNNLLLQFQASQENFELGEATEPSWQKSGKAQL